MIFSCFILSLTSAASATAGVHDSHFIQWKANTLYCIGRCCAGEILNCTQLTPYMISKSSDTKKISPDAVSLFCTLPASSFVFFCIACISFPYFLHSACTWEDTQHRENRNRTKQSRSLLFDALVRQFDVCGTPAWSGK